MPEKKGDSLQAIMRRVHIDGPPIHEDARGRLADALGRSERTLTKAWWHAHDVVEACIQMNESLADHHLAARFDPMALDQWMAPLFDVVDEEQLRRHQLGVLALEANRALEAQDCDDRFRCFHRTLAWEADEPPWLRVDPDEHATLITLFGGPRPGGIEAAYDGVMRIEDVSTEIGDDPAPLFPPHAVNAAREALRERRFDEALAAAEIGVLDSSHGVLAELVKIDALLHLTRTEEARAAWKATAERWLRGERTVWDTQWAELARLHGALGLSDDDLSLRVKAQAP